MKRLLLVICAGALIGLGAGMLFQQLHAAESPQQSHIRIKFPLAQCHLVAASTAFAAQQVTLKVPLSDTHKVIVALGKDEHLQAVMFDLAAQAYRIHGEDPPMTVKQSHEVMLAVSQACFNSDEDNDGHAVYYLPVKRGAPTTHL